MKKRILSIFIAVLLTITCVLLPQSVQAAGDFLFLVTNSYKTVQSISSISHDGYPYTDIVYVSPGKTFNVIRDTNILQDNNLWWRFRTPAEGLISASVNGDTVPTRQDTYSSLGNNYYYYLGGTNTSGRRTATVSISASAPVGTTAVLENKNGTAMDLNIFNSVRPVRGDDYNLVYIYVARPCTITYDNNNGIDAKYTVTGYTTNTGSTSQNIPFPAAPTAPNGYTFAGWSSVYYNTKLYQPDATYRVRVDDTVTAQWTPINYTISYMLNGGAVSPANPTSYNIETNTFTLNNPVREGYVFLGWTGSNGSTPSKSVKIEKGSTGNLSFTANWQEAPKYTATPVAGENIKSVSGAVTDYEGTKVTFRAECEPGTTFDGWYAGTTKVSGDSEYTFTLEGNVTYTAKATANTGTPYIVEHYKQNIDGTYPETPSDIDTLSGTTNSEVTVDTKNYEGFAAPGKQTVKINGDGSTKVVYQYTRNSYSVKGNIDNGGTVTNNNQSVKYEDSSKAIVFTAAEDYEISSITVNGAAQAFTDKKSYTYPSQTVTEDIEVKVFTEKALVKYTVEYYTKAHNDEYELKDTVTKKGSIGMKPEYDEKEYTGYNKVREEVPETIQEDGTTVIKVYYDEQTAVINYKSVNASYGTVSLESEGSIGVVSGIPKGSTAQAVNGYKLTGWYMDKDCTKPVDPTWIEEGKLVPQKTGGCYSDMTYYAKFEPIESKIEIYMHVEGDYSDTTKKFDGELTLNYYGDSPAKYKYSMADGDTQVYEAKAVHTAVITSVNPIANYQLTKITYKLPDSETEIELNVTGGITEALEIPEGTTELHIYYEKGNVINTGLESDNVDIGAGFIGSIGGFGILLIAFLEIRKRSGNGDE